MGLIKRIKALSGKGPPKETERKIYVNQSGKNAEFEYADNHIKTSKYNLITFLPRNLFEQFQRLANVYFLVLVILQFLPYISSLTPYTTIVPLVSVLALTAVKDLIDDIQRHVSDNQVNGRKSYVLRGDSFKEERWDEVVVGDVLRMENNQFLAADILLLSTSEPNGLCYIETADLDGETNLKPRQPLPETQTIKDNKRELAGIQAEIVCEPPNNILSRFEGKLTMAGESYALRNSHVLLRGCVLRNTAWCYGVVLFAGKDTKLMQNSGKTKFKRTKIDKLLNHVILGIVGFLFLLCVVLAFGSGWWEYVYGYNFRGYLPWEDILEQQGSVGSAIGISALLMFFSYVIVLNTLVPISLYVSVEIVRLAQSFWINWDSEMVHKDIPAKSRTTTLTEQLGQIKYIFSDKTGTLTQNVMTFNKCSINGKRYGDILDDNGDMTEPHDGARPTDFSSNPHADPEFRFYDQNILEDIANNEPNCDLFFRLLSICHTVMPDEKDGRLVYQAQSPDEGALVSAARNFGFTFLYRSPDTIRVEISGETVEYKVLDILDFNNVRKRMSVILEKDGEIILYCKGADNVIIERLAQTTENEELKETTNDHLASFAGEGLRTLCLAWKKIERREYDIWKEKYKTASLEMEKRDEKGDAVAEEIEKDLILIGASAIEDKLQDGVPDAIASLAQADIKLWVLTGDKLETAINIGYSCQLLTEEMEDVFIVDAADSAGVKKQLEDALENYSTSRRSGDYPESAPDADQATKRVSFQDAHIELKVAGDEGVVSETASYALVAEGKSLIHALHPDLEKLFLEVASSCAAVICCRVTPLQKAQVVQLVKHHKSAITLAIGDGANDVSMIKAAHIGVGISGHEGMQAVLASDFSIGQFRFLKRLLLVHGRWSYYRMAKFLRYFFYKNFAFTMTHIWYALYCGYSAQTAYDAYFITFYNLMYTAFPIIAVAVFDQDVDSANCLAYPKLYTPGHRDLLFNKTKFFTGVFHGLVTSAVLFFVVRGTLYYYVDELHGIQTFQTELSTILFATVTVEAGLDTAHWTYLNFVFIFGSVVVYFGLTLAIHSIPAFAFAYSGVPLMVYTSPPFWFTLILIVMIVTVPRVLGRFFRSDVFPALSDRVRYRQKNESRRARTIQLHTRPSYHRSTSKFQRRPSRFKRSGYAFSHEKGFGDLITSGTNMPEGKESGSIRLWSKAKRALSDKNGGMKHSFTVENSPIPEMEEVHMEMDCVDAESSQIATSAL